MIYYFFTFYTLPNRKYKFAIKEEYCVIVQIPYNKEKKKKLGEKCFNFFSDFIHLSIAVVILKENQDRLVSYFVKTTLI